MSLHILRGNRCKCSACDELFNSVYVFDQHRVGDWSDRGANRRCLIPSEMLARGWIQNNEGLWISGHRPPNVSRRQSGKLPETRSALTLTHGAAHG